MNDSVEVFEGELVKAAAVLPLTFAAALFWVLTVALLTYAVVPERLEIVTIGSPRSVALGRAVCDCLLEIIGCIAT